MHFAEIAEQRRAVNFFDPARPVPPELLRRMVEMAARAPSSYNLQPWSLVVLSDPDQKARLRKLAMDQPKITEAPVVLLVLADRDAWRPGHPGAEKTFAQAVAAGLMKPEQHEWFGKACANLYGSRPEFSHAFAVKNAAFFAMSLMYAAKELGLDTHPMDGFRHHEVREAFGIPENYWIPCLLAVGYFDRTRTLLPPKWRKSYEEIVVSFGK